MEMNIGAERDAAPLLKWPIGSLGILNLRELFFRENGIPLGLQLDEADRVWILIGDSVPELGLNLNHSPKPDRLDLERSRD